LPTVVFDTQALLILYLGEAGSGGVEAYLDEISRGKTRGYLNVINLAELYYVLRRKSKDVAEEKERNLLSFGVRIVPVTYKSPLWKRAATIKSEYALSLADAFAASTAMEHRCALVTGSDVEFEQVKNLKIERVGAK
jgi:predicted nucleic acid-binding protein